MSLEKDLVQECREAARAMGAFLAPVGQYKAKHSGTEVGFPDLVLICAGQIRLIETKRAKGGVVSIGQLAFIDRAAEQGVKVHVIDNVEDLISLINGCRKRHGVERR